jgi:hypothetical protein
MDWRPLRTQTFHVDTRILYSVVLSTEPTSSIPAYISSAFPRYIYPYDVPHTLLTGRWIYFLHQGTKALALRYISNVSPVCDTRSWCPQIAIQYVFPCANSPISLGNLINLPSVLSQHVILLVIHRTYPLTVVKVFIYFEQSIAVGMGRRIKLWGTSGHQKFFCNFNRHTHRLNCKTLGMAVRPGIDTYFIHRRRRLTRICWKYSYANQSILGPKTEHFKIKTVI